MELMDVGVEGFNRIRERMKKGEKVPLDDLL